MGDSFFPSLVPATSGKRERYAPSFHLDDEKSSTQKPGVVFQFLSGGYDFEIERLKTHLQRVGC